MITQIIVPTSNIFNLQVQIPDELIGKRVAISYEQEEFADTNAEILKADAKAELDKFYDAIHLDFSNFKFNREEANAR